MFRRLPIAVPFAVLFSASFAEPQQCIVRTPIGTGDDVAYGIGIQPDGKYVVTGDFQNANRDIALVRYNADGTLDPTFDPVGLDGIVTTAIGNDDFAGKLVLQTNEKVVVAGTAIFGDDDFAVLRYDTNGGLDTTFDPIGMDGIVTTPVGTLWDLGRSVTLQPDGKIVVGGYARVGGAGGHWDVAVARYNPDGSLDTSFNGTGTVITFVSANDDRGTSVKIQPDGKILLAGATDNGTDLDFLLVRYDPDGSLDTTFDPVGLDGIVTTPLRAADDWGAAIELQLDGKIVFAGESRSATDIDFAVVRYNSDGSLDTTFNGTGMAFTPIGPGDDAAFETALQPDGKILLVGTASNGANNDFAMVRYNPDGTLDTTFNGTGIVTTAVGPGADEIHDAAVQADGKIAVAGAVHNGANLDFAWARYNRDGTLDSTCGLHYRSIGTINTPLASAGTATVARGETTVTFTNSLPAPGTVGAVGVGDILTIGTGGNQETLSILDRPTANTVTVKLPATRAHSAETYEIRRAFNTIQSWEEARDGDLVGENRREIGVAYKDSTFTENVLFQGATTDASRYMHLTVAPGQRHFGRAGTGVVLDPAAAGHAFDVQSNYTRIEWFEVTGWTGASNEGVRIQADQTSYSHMIVHDPGGDPSADGFHFFDLGNWTATIRNTVLYNIDRAGIYLLQNSTPWNMVLNLENVTVSNCGYNPANPYESGGILACAHAPGSATIDASNVISAGNIDFDAAGDGDFNIVRDIDCDIDASWGSSDFNLSSDASAPGASSLTLRAASNQFVSLTPGAEDLHLKLSADAIDAGTPLTSAIDIDAQARPMGASWDIGADERPVDATCPTTGPPWYDTAWGFRKAVVIRSSMVSGNLSGFPVLLRRNADPELAASALASGDDILFTASDGVTKLPHEIEHFDGGSGGIAAWIKVPYVSSGTDSVIYMYYGNGSAASQEDVANVWSSGYTAVWHLHDDFLDSTGVNNATNNGSVDSPGQIADGQDFDGATQFISVSGLLGSPAELTVSAWVNQDTSNSQEVISLGDYTGLRITTAAGVKGFWHLGGSVWNEVPSGDAVAGEGWRYLTFTFRTGEQVIYVDANPLNTLTLADTIVYSGLGTDTTMGKHAISASRYFDGDIDELRVSSTVRPPQWIQTEFNNQSDPLNFCLLCAATTAVVLESFEAKALDAAVELNWRTATELDNLGFHLYRALSAGGPYERITPKPIPGLGSSPVGAQYRYRDSGLTNDVTYFYKLEDIETSGRTKLHGPVSATPRAGLFPAEETDSSPMGENEAGTALLVYGDPDETRLQITERGSQIVLVLETGGFSAAPLPDGTVALSVPGLDVAPEGSGLPVKRAWVDIAEDGEPRIVSVRERNVEVFTSLTPAGAEIHDVVASPEGAVRLSRRRGRTSGVKPSPAARLLLVGYQENRRKALLEISPFLRDEATRRLSLARRIEVVLSVGRPEAGKRERSRDSGAVLARLVTTKRGLHRFDVQELPRRGRVGSLELRRQGEPVAFHREGSSLFFWSEGPKANPFGNEAVYELSAGKAGRRMETVSSRPSGQALPDYLETVEREENRYYQAALLEAPDLWLWDILLSPERKSFHFAASEPLAAEGAIEVFLQGTSDLPVSPDHHVRISVNGVPLGETSWDGKSPRKLEAEIPAGALLEEDNVLEVENVGDTGAAYSMVMLDRFEVSYLRRAVTDEGVLEGQWLESGTAEVRMAPGAYVVDLTGPQPRWMGWIEPGSDGALRFLVEAGRSYVATASASVLEPELRLPSGTSWKSRNLGADYVVIGPSDFLSAAEPLLAHRRSEGLRVLAVPVEDLYEEFGYGESNPRAIRDFLSFAYREWSPPAPRYVLLLGDGTYDFKDYLATGVANRVPPLLVKTAYLWTASDPAYASVNGEDLLPDLAIGRLPAANADGLRRMIEKILAFEAGARLDGPAVLVADRPDLAGDFEANVNDIESILPVASDKLLLSRLGRSQTRERIISAFDEGASLMSYVGHGGIHLWANENIFNTSDVAALRIQPRQPILLTMNCLNGYFHFPYFDSLAEALLEAEDRGVVAAFSPSGLSLDAAAHKYHRALVSELYSGVHHRLGDAILRAQRRYAETGSFPELLAIYHLFGDPALRLR